MFCHFSRKFIVSAVAALTTAASLSACQSSSPGHAVAVPASGVQANPGAAVLAGIGVTAKPGAALDPSLSKVATDAAFANMSNCKAGAASTTVTTCVAGDTKSPRLTVALIGDSFAGEWSSALLQIADARHWKLVTLIHDSCPWTATEVIAPVTNVPYSQCETWGKSALRDLLDVVKPNVVIATYHPSTGVPAHPHYDATSAGIIAQGMLVYWRQLESAGIHIVGIAPTPPLGINAPDCLKSHPNDPSSCSVPASKIVPTHTAIATAVAALGSSEAALVDLNSLICTPTTCDAEVGNVVVYRDDKHLSKAYTLTLAPFLEKRLLAFAPLAH